MSERGRRGNGPQPSYRRRQPSHMRAHPAVHGHSHVLINPISGVIARCELDYPWTKHPLTIEYSSRQQHLVKRSKARCSPVPTPAWDASSPPRTSIA